LDARSCHAARAEAPQADALDLCLRLVCFARVSRRRPNTRLNHACVVLLSLILVWSGMGRGLMSGVEAAPRSLIIAGVEISLCDKGTGDGSNTGIGLHDCDICTLRAPFALPTLPSAGVPRRTAAPARLDRVLPDIGPSLREPDWHLPRGPPSQLA
jgi:hypothetical protein